jgi:hypothetical protein
VLIEQTIERGAAGAHALGHGLLGQSLRVHRLAHLARQNPLDGYRLEDSFFRQKTVEGRADMRIGHRHLFLTSDRQA